MNESPSLFPLGQRCTTALLALALLATPGIAQQTDEEALPTAPQELPPLPPGSLLQVEPGELELAVGDSVQLAARLVDGRGEPIEGHIVVFYSRDRRSVGVSPAGLVQAHAPGDFTVVALVPKSPEDEPRRAEPFLMAEVPVHVPYPPVASVEVVNLPDSLYAGTAIELETRVVDTTDVPREDVEVEFGTSNPEVATPDGFGFLQLHSPGRFTLAAHVEEAHTEVELEVVENPLVELTVSTDAAEVRTGDVVHLTVEGLDAEGRPISELPVQWTVTGKTDPRIIAAGAPAQVFPDGAFVAERSGVYTVAAIVGERSATARIEVRPRNVRKGIEFVGQGPVRDRYTSDLWVWEGTDGRDYAITGTWGAEGHAYVWDVTSPENITLIDTVRVDARTVNDVKVSEDGRLAVISREGASNRKNGLVILDVSEPQVGVRVLSRYDDQLRGGVHNVFIYDDHVYALSNGRRFDIINIEDPQEPYRVGRFELDTPGHSIHDVWVDEGIAYSSNWHDGVVAIDVGGGGKGGAPNNPVKLGQYTYPSGWNHAAYPYRSESTGKFYVFAGDEAFPYGAVGSRPGETPPRPDGWIHVIEWDDWGRPQEVARYLVPEAGTHNLWIEDDVMYVAYYNGGLRVVDVSGELRGDLYRQGREIASFMPYDPEGFVANSPFTWGPQPYKGHIFFSDWTSGLWAVKLVEPEDPEQIIGEPQ